MKPSKIESPFPTVGQENAKDIKPKCEHRWVFKYSGFDNSEKGPYEVNYIRKDYFFCERCLEEKTTIKSGWSRDRPDWYTLNT